MVKIIFEMLYGTQFTRPVSNMLQDCGKGLLPFNASFMEMKGKVQIIVLYLEIVVLFYCGWFYILEIFLHI